MRTTARQVLDQAHQIWFADFVARTNAAIQASDVFASGDRIYLFGSRANDRRTALSDTDLLVVLNAGDKGRKDRVFEIMTEVADDTLVVTANEFANAIRGNVDLMVRADAEKTFVLRVP